MLKHVVFANPNNKAAKDLLADTYEQLGYQAESGPWRWVYLQGAYELRNGVPTAGGIRHRQPRHDQGDAAGHVVRLPRGAAERAEGGGQEDLRSTSTSPT